MSIPNRLAKDPQDYERFGIRPSLIQPWEDGRRTDGSPGDWEWWYFDAQLDDGAKLIVVFQTKELAEINKPLTPTIRIDLTLPNGRQIDKLVELEPATFSASTLAVTSASARTRSAATSIPTPSTQRSTRSSSTSH